MSSEYRCDIQEIIQTELLHYLDGLPNNQLRSTTRKQCRLYLEQRLNQNLAEYKQQIKSILTIHIAQIKRRWEQQQSYYDPTLQPNHNHHHNHNHNHNQHNSHHQSEIKMQMNMNQCEPT